MKAWRVAEVGEPLEVMKVGDTPVPRPESSQLLVRVLGAPANFPDVLMCRGTYQVRPALPFTPGMELCGEVVAVGDGVTRHRVGDRVIGLSVLPHGAFAEYSVMADSTTFAAPPSLDDAEAASLYVGYQTGWFALHRRVSLQPDQTLLVHAAAGGVGSAAVQLGRAAGATVVAVVGGEAKVEVARRMGADVVVDRHREDFVQVVKELTDGRGADVVYDPVGGESYDRSTKCIAFEGSIIVVGFAGGTIQSAALSHALVKNYAIVGLHWALYNREDPGLVRECHAALTNFAERGLVRPFVSERLSLDEVAAGLQRLADGRTVGRVVMQASESGSTS